MIKKVTFLLLIISSGRQADTDNHRAGKLFFVATTVSTISTSTLCYTAAANLAACTGRRKRNINSHWGELEYKGDLTVIGAAND